MHHDIVGSPAIVVFTALLGWGMRDGDRFHSEQGSVHVFGMGSSKMLEACGDLDARDSWHAVGLSAVGTLIKFLTATVEGNSRALKCVAISTFGL